MTKPNWQQIQEDWETSKITFKDLAEKHNVKLGTLKSRRSREKWSRDATTKKDATRNKKMQPKKEIKEPVVRSDKLTEKQRLFCIYYIKYFNATKAYQKAYECAYTTAMVEGHRHLRNPKISEEIDRMRNDKLNEKKISVDDVIQKYIDIAFADIGDYVDVGEGGFSMAIKPLEQMDTSIISELSNTENGVKLKLSDKMKALDMLAKYTDMLSDGDKKRLDREKVKAETEFTNLRANQIKGETKDTSLLDALTEGRKQFEQMMKDREKNE